eukprot:12430165-Karenia_brevis.AAC.1
MICIQIVYSAFRIFENSSGASVIAQGDILDNKEMKALIALATQKKGAIAAKQLREVFSSTPRAAIAILSVPLHLYGIRIIAKTCAVLRDRYVEVLDVAAEGRERLIRFHAKRAR